MTWKQHSKKSLTRLGKAIPHVDTIPVGNAPNNGTLYENKFTISLFSLQLALSLLLEGLGYKSLYNDLLYASI
jgi:hypothetical protein